MFDQFQESLSLGADLPGLCFRLKNPDMFPDTRAKSLLLGRVAGREA